MSTQARALVEDDIRPYNGSQKSIMLHECRGEFWIGEARSIEIDDNGVAINLLNFIRIRPLVRTGKTSAGWIWTIVESSLKSEYSLIVDKPCITDEHDHLVFTGKEGDSITLTQEGKYRLLYLSVVRQYKKEN